MNAEWDILHVGHKFPALDTNDNSWLKRKLGVAVTQRRQFFRYAREHREKKAATSQPVLTTLKEPELHVPSVAPIRNDDLPETQTLVSSRAPASSFAQTTASTLAIANLKTAEQDSDKEDAISYTSFATSINDYNDGSRLQISRLQDIAKGSIEFECPYCFTIVRPRSQNQWKYVLRSTQSKLSSNFRPESMFTRIFARMFVLLEDAMSNSLRIEELGLSMKYSIIEDCFNVKCARTNHSYP